MDTQPNFILSPFTADWFGDLILCENTLTLKASMASSSHNTDRIDEDAAIDILTLL